MRILKFAVVALLVTTVSTAKAAIEASSRLTISSFLVSEVGGDGDLSNNITLVLPPVESASTSAALDGFATVSTGVVPGSVDGLVSSVGFAVGENAFPTHGSIGGVPFAFSDTRVGVGSSGSILVPSGAAVEAISGVGVSAGAPLAGSSTSTAGLTIVFFEVTDAVTIEFNFDAILDINLDNMASLPPLLATASGSFVTTIAGTGGGGVGFSYSTRDDPAFDALSSTTLSLGGVGSVVGPQVSGPFGSGPLFLDEGTYIVTLSQSTSAALSVIPEPASILVWGLLGTCAMSRRRNRSAA